MAFACSYIDQCQEMADSDSGPSKKDLQKYSSAVHLTSGEITMFDDGLDDASMAYMQRAAVAEAPLSMEVPVTSTWGGFSYEKWLGTTNSMRH